jgi:hypothetical protein
VAAQAKQEQSILILCVCVCVCYHCEQIQAQAHADNMAISKHGHQPETHLHQVSTQKLETVCANMATLLVTFFGYFHKLEGSLLSSSSSSSSSSSLSSSSYTNQQPS